VSNPFSGKQVVANILALFSGTALARALTAITLIVIARQLGPEAYGQYSASIALVGMATVLFSLGLDGWLLYRGGKDPQHLDVRFTSAFSLKTVLGAVWLVGVWAIAPHLNQASFPWILIVLASLSLWLEEIGKITWTVFKACMRNDLTLILMVISQALFLGITLWLASQYVQEPAGYMGGRLLAATLGSVVSSVLVARQVGFRLRLGTLVPTLRGTLPFAASIAFAMIYGRADLTIVANELGTTAAGLYAPAITLTNALFLIPAAVYGVMVPFYGHGDADNGAWVSGSATRLIPGMAVAGIALGIGLALIADPLVSLLYGEAFQASGDVLAILGGVLALRFPNMALAAVLVAVGWQIPRVGAQGVAAALNVALNMLLVHQVGVLGVARIYVLTEGILLLGYLGLFAIWMKKRRTGR
jgi:O-antigen/teichoic acid export membrane protein